MYQIKSIQSGKIRVHTSPTNLRESINLQDEARRNKLKVLEGVLSLENELSLIIAHYFHPDDQDRRNEFSDMILSTDWCSFAAKRKLSERIITTKSLLKGKEFSRYQKLLKDSMSYRNAFAHGKFSSDDNSVYLTYFQELPRTIELTDEYLKKVEKTLLEAFMLVQQILIDIGANQAPVLRSPESELYT